MLSLCLRSEGATPKLHRSQVVRITGSSGAHANTWHTMQSWGGPDQPAIGLAVHPPPGADMKASSAAQYAAESDVKI